MTTTCVLNMTDEIAEHDGRRARAVAEASDVSRGDAKDYFGEEVAARYDDDPEMFDPAVVDPAVDFLAALAGDGAALELGIGTGRIAVPLARRGVRVHGIDLSTAMVARLQAKPGTEEIGVTIGDFATTDGRRHASRLPTSSSTRS